MTRPKSPVLLSGLGTRLLALTVLALAVPASRLPVRWLQRPLGATRRLPAAAPCHAGPLHQAILRQRPRWWRGRIACLEVSLALMIGLGLKGRRAHWVLGSRPLPHEAHAWVLLADGTSYGLEHDDPVRSWVLVDVFPPLPLHPYE
jgi:hypothetical protein